jgi:hypothetical protein
MYSVFLFPVEYVLVLQQFCILADVLTAWKDITLLDVFECEETLVSLAHLIYLKVN